MHVQVCVATPDFGPLGKFVVQRGPGLREDEPWSLGTGGNEGGYQLLSAIMCKSAELSLK